MDKSFFDRNPEIVAKELLGKILIVNNLRARIVETEAYFGEYDPASWASKGDNKVSRMMNEEFGKILIYNVHKYKMLNFVTGKIGQKGAVLIRAVEPLNFQAKCTGPGLLTIALGINDKFHGCEIGKKIKLVDCKEIIENIAKTSRIGVRQDLEKPLRFYIKNNKYISKK